MLPRMKLKFICNFVIYSFFEKCLGNVYYLKYYDYVMLLKNSGLGETLPTGAAA